ncbi:MAG: hypothetical protein MR871_00355, partial [Lachnospiraceae bacterium]|nr:hypothetical protein [Lachnospiraceae bacterium]
MELRRLRKSLMILGVSSLLWLSSGGVVIAAEETVETVEEAVKQTTAAMSDQGQTEQIQTEQIQTEQIQSEQVQTGQPEAVQTQTEPALMEQVPSEQTQAVIPQTEQIPSSQPSEGQTAAGTARQEQSQEGQLQTEAADPTAQQGTVDCATSLYEEETQVLSSTSLKADGEEDTSSASQGSAEFTEQTVNNDTHIFQNPETFQNDPVQEEGSEGTVSENAIQKAIDAALKAAKDNADTTELTITVDEGTYDGDISISWDRGGEGNVPTVFKTLYILAKGSFEEPDSDAIDKTMISSSANGKAAVNGNILIDGINVVLAGLYYSLNSKITVKDSDTAIYGTTEDDNICVELNNASLDVKSGDGLDNIQITGTGQGGSDKKVDLDGGGGSDVYTVDMSAADTNQAGNTTAVTITDKDGGRLHLTGSLKETKASSDKNAEGNYNKENNTSAFKFWNNNGGILQIMTSGISSFTDELVNKQIKEISFKDLTDGKYEMGNVSFTNLVYKPDGEEISITVTGEGLFNNLSITDDKLLIKLIQAAQHNVVLSGKEIQILGPVNVKNLIVNAADDDAWVTIDTSGTLGSLGEKLDIDPEISASMFDVVSGATITLDKDGSITSSGDVVLNASSSQTSNLIPFLTGVNIANVKISDAKIALDGKITAGGSLTAKATSLVKIKASNEYLAKYFIPLAVGVIVAETRVDVGAEAVLKAKNDILLSSSSDVTLETLATVGSLPISLAVSVVVNDSHVNVAGNVISEEGNITLDASANANVTTNSTKVTSLTGIDALNPSSNSNASGSDSSSGTGNAANKFGGFFAVAVVLQDVDALLDGSGRLWAAGDIDIKSKSTETVNTTAESAGGSEEQNEGEGQTISGVQGKIVNLINGLKTSLISGVTTGINNSKTVASKKLNNVLGRVEGCSGNAISTKPSEQGAITAPARAEAGTDVKVKVSPNNGYKLTKLSYTYLPAGAKTYQTIDIDISSGIGTYTFKMPAYAITIAAEFEKTSGGSISDDEDLGLGDLFNEEENNNNMGISDIVNNGTSGTQEEENNAQNPVTTGEYEIANLEVFVTDPTTGQAVSQGAVLSSHRKANAGDTITFTINPAQGKRLVEGSLKAVYTNSDRKTITYTIPKNAAGKYVFTMPALLIGTELTLRAEFEDGATSTTTNSEGGTSSSQVTGALAINIVINKNEAYIDTTNEVVAGGTLSVVADGNTFACSNADASNFDHDAATQTTPKNPVDPNAS